MPSKLTDSNRLSITNPDLCEEWDYDKNGDLKPSDIAKGSAVKVWWRCKKAHSWKASVSERSKHIPCKECPYCSGRKISDLNRLSLLRPDLCKEWNYEKNGDLLPQNISYMSNKKVWWRCSENHEWMAVVSSRSMGRKCNKCHIGRTDNVGRNLQLSPKLCREWDHVRNEGSRPENYSLGSHEKVWWTCEFGHSWNAEIKSRSRGNGCPYCYGRYTDNANTLAFKAPQLLEEWDWKLNAHLDPNKISFGSGKRAWWICKSGHSWSAVIEKRTKGKRGCPYCSNQKVSTDNCLSKTNARLSAEWDYDKNEGVTPDDVVGCSGKKIWWMCKNGHSWKTLISVRDRGANCPHCQKVELRDGYMFDSLAEAYYYLKLKAWKIDFIYNKRYGFKRKGYRFDFYIPSSNTYIEVTAYNKKMLKNEHGRKLWTLYLKKIRAKRYFVKKKLKAEFRFIQIKLNSPQLKRINAERVN